MMLYSGISSFHLPGEVPTVTWQWMTEFDGDKIFEVIQKIEESDNPPYRTSRDEVEQLFQQTRRWVGVVGIDEYGQCCAFMHTRLRLSQPVQVRCNGGVVPNYRGLSLGSRLVAWQASAARYLTQNAGKEQEVQVVCRNEYHDSAYSSILQQLGYSTTSTFYEMRTNLKVLPSYASTNPLLEIVPWVPSLENMVRMAALEFAADAVNSKGRSMEQWMSNRSRFAPDLSFVALDKSTDRTQIAGFLMTAKYTQDWDVLGWSEGYIDLLEVGMPWRNTEVGRELVVACMHACAKAGLEKVATGVSSHHEASAARLFGNLGFVEVCTQHEFALKL